MGRDIGSFYGSTGLGYRRRGGRVNDELLFNLEVGRRAGRLLLKLAFDGVRSTAEPPDIYGQTVVLPLPGGGGTLPDLVIGDQHIAKVNPAIACSIGPRLAIQADLFHTLSGTNTLLGTTYSFAVVFASPGK